MSFLGQKWKDVADGDFFTCWYFPSGVNSHALYVAVPCEKGIRATRVIDAESFREDP